MTDSGLVRLIVLAFWGPLSAVGWAQTSQEFAVMGRAAWSAFQCSSIASAMKDAGEEERLFTVGYRKGKAFIEATQAGKVKEEDVRQEMPVGFSWRMHGPTPDFILGRVYEAAQEDALKGIYATGTIWNDDKTRNMLARGRYTERNCQFLGARQ